MFVVSVSDRKAVELSVFFRSRLLFDRDVPGCIYRLRVDLIYDIESEIVVFVRGGKFSKCALGLKVTLGLNVTHSCSVEADRSCAYGCVKNIISRCLLVGAPVLVFERLSFYLL